MNRRFAHYTQTLIAVLVQPHYQLLLLVLSLLFFGVFITLPVLTIPGNTLSYQLSLFRIQDYALMVILALLIGLNVTLRIYAMRQKDALVSSVQGSFSGLAATFAAIVGTATCSSCLASLFLLLGLGTGAAFFVLEHQTIFLAGAILLVLASLYFSLQKAVGLCSCTIPSSNASI